MYIRSTTDATSACLCRVSCICYHHPHGDWLFESLFSCLYYHSRRLYLTAPPLSSCYCVTRHTRNKNGDGSNQRMLKWKNSLACLLSIRRSSSHTRPARQAPPGPAGQTGSPATAAQVRLAASPGRVRGHKGLAAARSPIVHTARREPILVVARSATAPMAALLGLRGLERPVARRARRSRTAPESLLQPLLRRAAARRCRLPGRCRLLVAACALTGQRSGLDLFARARHGIRVAPSERVEPRVAPACGWRGATAASQAL